MCIYVYYGLWFWGLLTVGVGFVSDWFVSSWNHFSSTGLPHPVGLDKLVCVSSYCSLLCHGQFIALGGMHFSEGK